jgi:hypothetical protein
LERSPSRASFVRGLAAEASSGKKALVLAPLGAGKTHALVAAREALRSGGVPFVFIDLFTAASTPERAIETLCRSVSPFLGPEAAKAEALLDAAARDRHQSPEALLRLLELLSSRGPATPFVWLVDEITEIRSLAYFPGLDRVETALGKAIANSRGAIVTSSYLGLARDLFPDLTPLALPPLQHEDIARVPLGRGRADLVDEAIAITSGGAATLFPLLSELGESKDVVRSLVTLLQPGAPLELVCRRHYEVLLMRSRGYAVSKRAAEVVAGGHGLRLTDLYPRIGRTAGASRQYLRWLVEVGLLTQTRKRYNFADPVLGLWASLYLGRGSHPAPDEIEDAVRRLILAGSAANPAEEHEPEPAGPPGITSRRPDRFEEFD